jgi:hypothetical protein
MQRKIDRALIAIRDYFLVLVPPIFFGTVIFVDSIIIPLQLLTILGLVELIFYRVVSNRLISSLLWLWAVVVLLLGGTLLASGGALDEGNAKQLAMRVIFAIYTVALFIRLLINNRLSPVAVRAALITLRFLFLYGIYELFAKANGLPLPLNALSNNPSYTNALKVTSEISGWIEFYRAQSIWPEPSFAIFPIILFWVLSDGEDMPIGRFDIALMTVFAAVTFSRTVWIGMFILLLTHFPIFRGKSKPMALGLALIFSIALLNLSSGTDHSASVRAETTMQGFEIASKDVYRGIGFNEYKNTDYAEITQETVIHNTVSSYVASMGWPIGLALLLLFIMPLWAPRAKKFSYFAPLVVVLVFTMSDAFYFTPVYFLIAYGRAKNLSFRSLVS